ncbi:alpha-tocopherol transfer protein-like [Cochliomyia hominivorax]
MSNEIKLDLEEPNEMLKEKALQELRETPENIENGLKELRKLLEAEKNLIVPMDNVEWLTKYLRVCKYYPESARDLVQRFYKLRQKYAEISKILIPSKLKTVFEENLVTILPQRDQHGRRIVLTLSGKHWNTQLITQDQIFAASTLCSDLLEKEPSTQINGIVYIVDLQGLSLKHVLQMTPYRTKRCLDYLQNNVPIRMKGFHIVNQPKIFQPIFTALKPFFTAKYAKRIVLHGSNWKSLHEYISPDCLPECYGGTLKTKLMFSKETYELLSEHESYYEELQNYGYKNDNK